MKTIFSNKVYDALKWVCIIFLPALAVLVRSLFPIWSLPLGEEISATIVAINAFLGACLCISNAQYNVSKAQDNQDAYKEMLRQNNGLRDDMVAILAEKYEAFEEEAKAGEPEKPVE